MNIFKQKRVVWVVGLIAVVVIAGLVLGYVWKKKGGFSGYTASVYVAPTQQAQWQSEIDATGSISAIKGIMLRAEVSGQVTKISFKSGQAIEKDAPVIQIYPDILNAQLKRAQSALILANMEYERGRKLLDKNVMSQQDFDKLNAQYQQAQSSVDELQAQLRQHNITAPFAGRAGLRRVSLGDHLSPGDAIVNIQQLDPIRVEFSVPEVYLAQLAAGQRVELMPASNPHQSYEGQIYAIDSAVDPQTRSVDVWANVPNKDEALLPGTFAKVRLFAGRERTVTVVPQTALVYDLAGTFVYEAKDNTAKKVRVTIGERRGGNVEILSGLAPNVPIVTAGQVKLFDGAHLKIETPQPEKQSTSADTAEK